MNPRILVKTLYPIAGIALVILAWHFYVVWFDVVPIVLPAPGGVLASIVENRELLLAESWVTFVEIILGFALAVGLGIPIAVMMTESRTLNHMFYPLLIATQSVPKVALAPMVLVWFGLGIESKLAIAFLVAFFPIVVDTAAGLQSTPRELLDLARSLRSTRLQTFVKIQFPAALPFVFSGAKVAVTLAVIGAVIGEFVGADAGLGNLLETANSQMDSALAWAALIALSVLGILLFGAVVLAERILMPWADGGGHG